MLRITSLLIMFVLWAVLGYPGSAQSNVGRRSAPVSVTSGAAISDAAVGVGALDSRVLVLEHLLVGFLPFADLGGCTADTGHVVAPGPRLLRADQAFALVV